MRVARLDQCSRVGKALLGLAISVAMSGPLGASAQPAPEEPIADPDNLPAREQLNKDPAAAGLLLFELLEKAELAEKNKDYAGAAKYYAAIGQAVPERAVAFSKLCEMYQALGERDKGVAACYRATGLQGVKVADNLRYASLLLSKPAGQPLSDAEVKELRSTFEHLRKSNIDNREADVLECQFAVAMEDADAMKQCVARLEDKLPGSPITLTYQMSVALFERDFPRAKALIEEARNLNMSPESVALMQAEVEARENSPAEVKGNATSSAPPTTVMVSLAAAATALAAGIVVWGRRRRPKAA